MRGIYAQLERDEKNALLKLAERERRDPRQQAALLIRQQLEKMGLLPPIAIGSNEDGSTPPSERKYITKRQ